MELIFQNIKNYVFNLGSGIKHSALNFFLTLLVAIFLSPTPFVYADSFGLPEYKVKAVFIYNFTKFIRWPENIKVMIKKQGLNFCVVGDDPFGNHLVEMSKAFRAKGVTLLANREVSFDEITKCQILFIAKSARPLLDEILKKIARLPVLVVGDSSGFAQKGVGINFFLRRNKIRFEINRKALKMTGLWVSSELLKRATLVDGDS